MTVRVYSSEDFGAPQLLNSVGHGILALDACLVNGYGDQTVTITNDGTTATVLFPIAHGINTKICKMTISGANESDYNGEHTVTVLDSVRVTYPIANSPVSPATGTITCRKDGCGWTKPFSGTNEAVYTMNGGTGFSLSAKCNQTVYMYCRGLIKPASLSDALHKFPPESTQDSKTVMYINSSSSTATKWVIIATETSFYFLSAISGSNWTSGQGMFFGDFASNNPTDTGNCILMSKNNTSTSGVLPLNTIGDTTGQHIATNYNSSGYSKSFIKYGHICNFSTDGGLNTTFPYINPVDNKIHMSKYTIFLSDEKDIRGTINGMWHVPGIYNSPWAAMDIFEGSGNLAGKTFLVLGQYTNYLALFEISDTY